MYFVQIQRTLELFSSLVICFYLCQHTGREKIYFAINFKWFLGQTSRARFFYFIVQMTWNIFTRGSNILYMLSSYSTPPLRSACIGRLCLPTQREEGLRGAMIKEAEG
jgi:hypothetical protein